MKQTLAVIGKAAAVLAVLAIAALPAVFMNSVYGYLPVLLALTLLALSLICLLVLSRSLSIQSGGGDVQCRRGQTVEIALKLVNRTVLFCPRATAHIFISDLFGSNDAMRTVRFTIAGRESVDFGFSMEMEHIGCFQIGLEHVELCDFFGLFHKSIPVGGRFCAVVTPCVRSMEHLHRSENVLSETSQETKISVVGGTDYTGIRAYALGDPMKQIHWKLSAHTREYVTKLQESSRRQEFDVILDLTAPALEKKILMDLSDCLIETALSLTAEAATQDAGYALLYTDRSGDPARTVPTGREDDADLIRSFACIQPRPLASFPDACQLLRQEGQGQNRGSNVAVVTARVTSELLQELVQVKQQRRSPELYVIVPAEWSSRELETACAPLRRLDDEDIPYFVVSTAENFKVRTEGSGERP